MCQTGQQILEFSKKKLYAINLLCPLILVGQNRHYGPLQEAISVLDVTVIHHDDHKISTYFNDLPLCGKCIMFTQAFLPNTPRNKKKQVHNAVFLQRDFGSLRLNVDLQALLKAIHHGIRKRLNFFFAMIQSLLHVMLSNIASKLSHLQRSSSSYPSYQSNFFDQHSFQIL